MTLLQRDRENIELGREEGQEEGREEGREKGSNQMASLIKMLLSENRTEELNRALEDPDFRNRLFEEYDIL
jgi:flagellar biosynthesis/type III secretory pathway protein FliH